MTILPSTNTDWGFWGTIRHHADPAAAWPLATAAIGEATHCPDFAVRDFLDSRHGRHFADEVANGLALGLGLPEAIATAVATWMGWRIGRHLERQHGIPRDLPYLTGLVTHCEILAEASD